MSILLGLLLIVGVNKAQNNSKDSLKQKENNLCFNSNTQLISVGTSPNWIGRNAIQANASYISNGLLNSSSIKNQSISYGANINYEKCLNKRSKYGLIGIGGMASYYQHNYNTFYNDGSNEVNLDTKVTTASFAVTAAFHPFVSNFQNIEAYIGGHSGLAISRMKINTRISSSILGGGLNMTAVMPALTNALFIGGRWYPIKNLAIHGQIGGNIKLLSRPTPYTNFGLTYKF